MTQLQLFEAAHNRNGTAIVDATGEHGYTELLDASARVAAQLLGDKDDLAEARVAFLVSPGFEYAATQWGIWRAGGVAVPLGLNHPPPELAYALDDADVAAVFVEAQLQERIAEIAAQRALPVYSTVEVAATPSTPRSLPDLDSNRRAMILYTSGSTGRPKGVVTTHAQIQAQIDALVEAWEWSADDRILHVLPLHHIHGVINVLGCALRVGAVCQFIGDFEARQVWRCLASRELTLFMAVPTIYAKLIAAFNEATREEQAAWSAGARQLRLMVSGSAALPVPTLETWEQITGQRLLERYGMTEIGMGLSNPLRGERRPGHVGEPLPNVEIRRANDRGESVDDDTPAEIEVRGPNVFLEYWRRDDETRSAFRDDGWFRTGDVAVVDEGSYRILGRNSVDIIKTGGYKVSALEIEDVLRTHPLIDDCAVVGVPDDEWGERVAVCVVGNSVDLNLDDLRDWAKQRLASYKAPTLLQVCDELPRNAMGKVQKPTVRERFTSK
ncbi:MAG: acyl-CoA synthetase [Pirellulaceae bacterium]|jgi:malonyl-CoA/methylmalonyl-CoA synthetase|nr:acyl-CoA synthetase [Pirellulaceae bacterium]